MWFLLLLIVSRSGTGTDGKRIGVSYLSYGLRKIPSGAKSSLLIVRGGASLQPQTSNSSLQPVSVTVSVSVGVSYLDKTRKILVSRNSTVRDLKNAIHHKFPSNPPPELQRLFWGRNLLQDDTVLESIASSNHIPVLLDMLAGTATYDRPFTVSQALEAYAASIVQQTYITDQLSRSLRYEATHDQSDGAARAPAEGVDEAECHLLDHWDLFRAVNESLHRRHAEEVAAALTSERNPDAASPDTSPWRGPPSSRHAVSPLSTALAKEFDLNGKAARTYCYLSVLLVVRSYRHFDPC